MLLYYISYISFVLSANENFFLPELASSLLRTDCACSSQLGLQCASSDAVSHTLDAKPLAVTATAVELPLVVGSRSAVNSLVAIHCNREMAL